MARAWFGILGTVQIRVDDAPVPIEALQLRRLVACLLLTPGRAVPAEVLVESLWPDEGSGGARPRDPGATLRVYASRLRTVLPEGVGLPREVRGYCLQVERDDVDAGRFEQLVRSVPADYSDDPAAAAAALREALSLWRGPALAEFREESWALGAAVRLDELRLASLERLNDARLTLGEHGELCGELEHLVDENPLRERLWGQLMLALYRSGRQADALRAFQRLRERLVDELGIEPSRELVALESAVLGHDRALDLASRSAAVADTPAVVDEQVESLLRRPLDRPVVVHYLPAQVTTFVGRERESAEIRSLLDEARLLTLTGSGGAGKTRLALEVASRVSESGGVPVCLVELAAARDEAEVDGAVAAAFAVKAPAGVAVREALCEAIRSERVLLLLDNCEHLVAECAALAADILRSCPDVTMLATSREPLGVHGEAVYRVPSLGLPAKGVDDLVQIAREDSVRLFVERARAQQPSFVLDASSAPRVASLCRRLDGIPLALELAAARLRVLSLSQVHDRLDERFRLLVGGARTRLPRQQTLEALIDWSYDLLGERERGVFRRLAVFTGSFDLEAAEEVLGASGAEVWAVLDQMSSLVDKSLVVAELSSDASRYRLLESIRQYGLAKLAAEDGGSVLEQAMAAHAHHYLGLVERAAPLLSGGEQLHWLDRIDQEFDNIRVALGHLLAAEGETRRAMSMVVGLGRFVEWRGHEGELLAATEALEDRPELFETDRLAVQAVLVRSRLLGQIDPSRANERLKGLLETARSLADESLIAEVLGRLSAIAWSVGLYGESNQFHAEATTAARAGGAYDSLLLVLNAEAASREERLEALRLATAAHDEIGRYMVLCSLGAAALDAGDVAAARTYFEEALPIIEREKPSPAAAGPRREPRSAPREDIGLLDTIETHATSLMPSLLTNLATALVLGGESERARPIYRRALDAARRHLDERLAGYGLFGLALCATQAGEVMLAGTLHGAAEAQLQRAGFALEETERKLAAEDEAHLRSLAGSAAFELAREQGRAMPKDEAMELALGRRPVGGVAMAAGEHT
jgi:predicted ATPase/DNA-binding SARP family transcriptional activator